MDSLAIALPVFFASAAVVVLGGVGLAVTGDAIADSTGWGRLWVGALLVSISTSLPELITNVSAVAIGTPALALGNVFGANMINMFTLSLVALAFGVPRLFANQPRQTQYLAAGAVLLGVIVLALSLLGDAEIGPSSVSGLVVLAAYVGAMRVVYKAGQTEPGGEGHDEHNAPQSSRRAWIGFGIASLAVIAAAPFLAVSADGIADATGLAASFIGVLLVSIVTTLPEATVSVTAALRNSPGLVIGNLYGSCAFNLSVLFYADLANAEPLLDSMGSEHTAALVSAIALMAAGVAVLYAMRAAPKSRARAIVPAIAVAYPAAMLWVFTLA